MTEEKKPDESHLMDQEKASRVRWEVGRLLGTMSNIDLFGPINKCGNKLVYINELFTDAIKLMQAQLEETRNLMMEIAEKQFAANQAFFDWVQTKEEPKLPIGVTEPTDIIDSEAGEE